MSKLISVGNRKLMVGGVLLVAGLATTYFKGDVPPNLLSFLQALFGFYVIGNGMEHWTAMKAEQKKEDK